LKAHNLIIPIGLKLVNLFDKKKTCRGGQVKFGGTA
jgi:hypothetical protein